jgi:hypothetical protein
MVLVDGGHHDAIVHGTALIVSPLQEVNETLAGQVNGIVDSAGNLKGRWTTTNKRVVADDIPP